MTLTDAPIGSRVRIHHLHSLPETSMRLRELGFCENALLRCVMKSNGNIICEISNTRIGLGSTITDTIVVSPSE